MSFLNKYDSTDSYKNFFCEKAAERVGDFYKSRQDNIKAIAYYDSADTKYRDKLQFCGNAYYIDFIPRRYKVSLCYLGLNNIKQAIATLTPYIFDNFGSEYFDSLMTSYYVMVLNRFYSKQEIQAELNNAIDNIGLNYKCTFNKTGESIKVNCKIRLFDTDLQLAGYETSTKRANEIPFHSTKDFFIRQFKELEVYKRLQNCDELHTTSACCHADKCWMKFILSACNC